MHLTAVEAKATTPVFCPNDLFSRCERNREGEFIAVEGVLANILGLNETVDRHHRVRYEDLDVDEHQIKGWNESEAVVMASKPHTMHRSSTWTFVDDQWLYGMEISYRTEQDTSHVTSKLFSGEARHPMWYEQLDFGNKQLYMPMYDSYISSRDIQLMRMLLMGLDRQQMADALFISVYAIDKRLALFRSYRVGGEGFQQGMAESGLASFILDCPDWFSSHGFHARMKGLEITQRRQCCTTRNCSCAS